MQPHFTFHRLLHFTCEYCDLLNIFDLNFIDETIHDGMIQFAITGNSSNKMNQELNLDFVIISKPICWRK
jgi:hypothetical protein